mmetsp:Transcript_89591/g.267206  ORF Transcript_89591/g.267206 Transcript_89591/m.267206 type:complete len:206 (-) Transcript_89591:1029-1646(-)
MAWATTRRKRSGCVHWCQHEATSGGSESSSAPVATPPPLPPKGWVNCPKSWGSICMSCAASPAGGACGRSAWSPVAPPSSRGTAPCCPPGAGTDVGTPAASTSCSSLSSSSLRPPWASALTRSSGGTSSLSLLAPGAAGAPLLLPPRMPSSATEPRGAAAASPAPPWALAAGPTTSGKPLCMVVAVATPRKVRAAATMAIASWRR